MEANRQSGIPFYFLAQECHVGYDRLVNEDALGSFSTPNGKLFVVADGLRGHAGGGVASRLAMAAFHKHLMLEKGEPAELMRQAVARADNAVMKAGETHPELNGLGARLAALLLKNNEAWYINVGDSLIYLATASGLRRLSREGFQRPENIAEDNNGAGPHTLGGRVDIASLSPGRHFYRADDSFLLSSAGLQSLVDENEIQNILGRSISLEEKARMLIERAIETNGNDNISLQLIVFKPDPEEADTGVPLWLEGWKGLIIGLICGLTLATGLFYAVF